MVIVLVLRNSGCTTVYNKSKLTVTEAHTITLHQSFALNAHFIVIGNHTVMQVLAFVNRILLELWKSRYELTVYMCTNMAANCKVVT